MSAVITTDRQSFAVAMLNPTTYKEAMEVATTMANSSLVPSAFRGKPADIIVAAAMGARVGLDMLGSLLGICVINGRPSLWGDAFLGVIINCPLYEDHNEEWLGKAGGTTLASYPDDFMAKCSMKRKGRDPKVATFSVAQAKIANLWGKQGPWTTSPTRMLMMRARSFAGRDAFADALQGFEIREVLEDDDFRVIDSQPLADAKVPAPPVTVINPGPTEAEKLKAAVAAKATLAEAEKMRAADEAEKAKRADQRNQDGIDKANDEAVRAREQEQRGAETEAITKAPMSHLAQNATSAPAKDEPIPPHDATPAEDLTTIQGVVAYANRLFKTFPKSYPAKSLNRARMNAGLGYLKIPQCPPDKLAELVEELKMEERWLSEMDPETIAKHWTANP